MTSDDERERRDDLRRIAYGRTTSADDEARAAAAQRQIEHIERVGDLGPAPGDEPAIPEAHPLDADLEKEHAIARSRGWLISAAVALVVGIFLGGAVTTLAGGPSAGEPAPTPTFTPGSSPLPHKPTVVVSGTAVLESGHGVVEAAMRWFEPPQVDTDLFAGGMFGSLDVDMTSTRLAHAGSEGSVWVAMTIDRRLCVLVKHATTGDGGAGCVDDEKFDQHGITVRVPGANGQIVAMWDGFAVTVSTPAP